jgi:hypothetical protein
MPKKPTESNGAASNGRSTILREPAEVLYAHELEA